MPSRKARRSPHGNPLSTSHSTQNQAEDEGREEEIEVEGVHMMHLRHVANQQACRLSRRYPFLRRLSAFTTLLTLLWLCAVCWGERSTFAAHIKACAWNKWESWPANAAPHHLVFVADPQLVDPHTYPGRPWPLSTATERYTDLYMARNFKLINANLDPDSVILLGDLFDGGREWAPSVARPLKNHQRKFLEKLGVLKTDKKPQEKSAETTEKKDEQPKAKRSIESYNKAIQMPHDHIINKKDHWLTPDGRDLKQFVSGENGRWSAWDQKQWDADFERFGRIFFDPEQMYPYGHERQTFAMYEVLTDQVAIENGARNVTYREYATSGGKQRRVIASLPGNHDVGFGMGVQLPVRDRFHSHFGETNRIDIIGNHTFISLDTPSLSAYSQFLPEGGETSAEKQAELDHIWKPTMNFLEDLRTPAGKAVSDALHEYYPKSTGNAGYSHAVTSPEDTSALPSTADLAKDTLKPRIQLPVILLTHVPLYRDSDTDCGKLREKGHAISVSAGYQYQNVVTRSLSNTIANKVSAAGEMVHVFSGDDHDYCDITHRYNVAAQAGTNGNSKLPRLASVKETTVKSFSWAMGIRHPGFQLVSLWNPVDEKGETEGTPLTTVQTHMCLLPDQLSIFIDYALLLVFTLIALLLRAVIIGLRYKPGVYEDDTPNSPTKMTLPRYRSKLNGATTRAKSATSSSEKHGRQRTASTSTSSNHNSGTSLGVQRIYNARTRSVSPANGLPNLQQHTGPLIEKAGFYPQVPAVRWADPSDADDSDEESRIGSDVGPDGDYGVGLLTQGGGDDSQAKWKRRRRAPGKARKAVEEFFVSLVLVGVPSGLWYVWLVRHG